MLNRRSCASIPVWIVVKSASHALGSLGALFVSRRLKQALNVLINRFCHSTYCESSLIFAMSTEKTRSCLPGKDLCISWPRQPNRLTCKLPRTFAVCV